MADLRIADAPEIALENITGNEKIPTGGYGNSAVTINILGQFAKNTLSLATEEYVSSAVGQKENKITLTGLNLTPTSTLVEIPQTNNSVLNTIHQDLLNRMEWIKDNTTAITDHQALTNRAAFNTHPSSSISHNGTSNVSIEIEELKNDILTINTTTIPELENAIVGKQDVIVNDVNLIATSELSNVPSTNNSALNNSLQALINRDKFIDDNIKTGLQPVFDQSFANSIGGYPLNARLMLDNGDIVRSTVANNTANPNVDMTGWVKVNSASQIFDESGLSQQQLNDLIVTPQKFGAKGDGVFDDRPAFQAAIDYLRENGGGELVVPKPEVRYMWKSYDATNSACLVIDKPLRSIYVDPISIRGMANLTEIKVDLGSTVIEAAVLLKDGGLYKKFENLSIWGGKDSNTKNCRYVMKSVGAWFPNFTMRQCQLYVAVEDCLKIETYVTILEQVQTAYSKRGIVIAGGGNPQTSVTLNSCYALNHDHFGYWFAQTTYCVFNACAADRIINNLGDGVQAYPYYIDIARGVTFNGCGAESSTRILKVRSAQGLVVNGLMTLSIGDSANPPNDLIRIDGGASTTIAGVWIQNPKGYKYKLSLGNAISAESVTVLDQSIFPSEVQYVSNYRFERPIRFLLWDYSWKTQDSTLVNTGDATTNTDNLNNLLNLFSYDRELIHDVIIRFPSGDFPINGTVNLISKFTRGFGKIRLIGHSDGTSRITVSGWGVINFGVNGVSNEMNYEVENLNLFIGTVTEPNKGFHFYTGNILFINSKITSDNGYRQLYSPAKAKLVLDSASSIQTKYFGNLNVAFNYKATTPPITSTNLPSGTIFYAMNVNATRYAWINSEDNGLNWMPLSVSNPSGITANRPTTGIYVGYQYFDTALGKPIYVKSTSPVVWVDSTGTTV